MYEEYGITQEEYENILNEYGDVNEETIRQYFGRLSEKLSEGIKDSVYDNKKETTKFMDNTKALFFTGLLLGYGYTRFSQKLDQNYKDYKKDIAKQTGKGYKFVEDAMKPVVEYKYTSGEELLLTTELNELLSQFKLDTTSTKTANDRYIKLIKNYYKKTEKTVEYFQNDITLKEYLARKVDRFDK